jgi:hypothetical protein
MVQGQEPGHEDSLIGLIYIDKSSKIPVKTSKGEIIIDAGALIFFFWNEKENTWVDRMWRISLDHKIALPAVKNARSTANPSELPSDWKDTSWFEAGLVIPSMEGRKVGWWEDAIASYSQLFFWIVAYTLAKSVKITELKSDLTRQQRRYMERHGQEIPPPWHKVWVEPKLYLKGIAPPTEAGAGPNYRFDVISHVRFNKHKKKDGSYNFTVEIVPDHQRGLKNEIYIPKTYHVGKKKVLVEMERWMGEKFK